jgi:hypothetical protein
MGSGNSFCLLDLITIILGGIIIYIIHDYYGIIIFNSECFQKNTHPMVGNLSPSNPLIVVSSGGGKGGLRRGARPPFLGLQKKKKKISPKTRPPSPSLKKKKRIGEL